MTTLSPEDTMEILALATKLRDLCQRTGAGVGISAASSDLDVGAVNVAIHHREPDVGDAVGVGHEWEAHRWTSYTLCGVPVDVFHRADVAGAK